MTLLHLLALVALGIVAVLVLSPAVAVMYLRRIDRAQPHKSTATVNNTPRKNPTSRNADAVIT